MKAQTISLLTVLLVLPTAVFSADTAYTWTDANGTRHYSEEPPYDSNIAPVEIELLPAPSAGNSGAKEDFYSVINQANRMESNRLKNEKLSSDKIQAEKDTQRAVEEVEFRLAPPANGAAKGNTRYLPAYPQNTSNQQSAAPYGRPLQAKPGDSGQDTEYVPMNRPGN